MNTTKAKHWVSLSLALLAFIVGSLYVYFWRFGYNSDYAMIGLLAKRILTTGEQFIFVPKVGYQGLLYEANLVALMFKLFGMSPVTINFAPFLTYLGFCFVFYRAVRAWHGTSVARLATLLVILSNPIFYWNVLRTQPNYGETFLMGSALFWIYRLLLDSLSGKKERSSLLARSMLFGFVAGYGLYTYGQIVYFLGAIGLHVLLLACYDLDFKWSRPTRIALAASWVNFLFGFVTFLFSIDQIQFSERVVLKFIPIAMIKFSVTLSVLAILIDSVHRRWKTVKTWIPALSVMGLTAVVGISPKFYYLWVEHGTSLGKMGISGTFPDIAKRAGFLWIGQKEFFNFSGTSILSWMSLVAGIFFLGVFNQKYFKVLAFPARKKSQDHLRKIAFAFSPFFFMIWVVIFSYLAASSVVDAASIRYALPLVLSFSVAYSSVILEFLASTQVGWKKAVAICAVGIILMTNTRALYRSFSDERNTRSFDLAVNYLKQKGLTHGFGDYWHSYVITFLANEEITIEPIVTNYIPFYFDQVTKQSRVAYLDTKPYKIPFSDGVLGQRVDIYGSRYEIKEKATIEDIDIFTLEKIL